MPHFGIDRAEEVRKTINTDWEALFGMLDPGEFVREETSFIPFDGVEGQSRAAMPLQSHVASLDSGMGRQN
jgi:hypothetical protein